MCYTIAAQHSCGHQHQSFTRCFVARVNELHRCNINNFPVWQFNEASPCPACRTQRRQEVAALLRPRGPGANSNEPPLNTNAANAMPAPARSQNLSQVIIQPLPWNNNAPGPAAPQNQHGMAAVAVAHPPPTYPLPDTRAAAGDWIPPSQRLAGMAQQQPSGPSQGATTPGLPSVDRYDDTTEQNSTSLPSQAPANEPVPAEAQGLSLGDMQLYDPGPEFDDNGEMILWYDPWMGSGHEEFQFDEPAGE